MVNDPAALPACGYCGRRDQGPLQAEHVVPRCLWNSNRPTKMITIAACGECNQGYGADEEYFRTALVVMAGADAHPQVEALLAGKVKRSLAHNRRLGRELTRVADTRPRFTPSGIYAGVGASFRLDLTRFNRCVEKTVRGLFYFKSGRPLSDEYAVSVPANSLG